MAKLMTEKEAQSHGLRIVRLVGDKPYAGRNRTKIGPIAEKAVSNPKARIESEILAALREVSEGSEGGRAARALRITERTLKIS
ncbi:MAG: hypothetical protein AABY32_01985 [Nanoarchaeota archaeon]